MMMLPVTAKEDLPTAMIPSAYSFFNGISAWRTSSGSATEEFATVISIACCLWLADNYISDQLPRQKRWILQLLHARRYLADLVRLTQRSELNVAYTLARFHQWGYIEPTNKNLSQ